jgi:hypothetical protein
MLRVFCCALLLCGCAARVNAQANAQERNLGADSQEGKGADRDYPSTVPDWLVPVSDFNNNLPSWLRFDGQFRDRLERFGNNAFKPQNDTHDLTQLRLMMILQPTHWLTIVGETQDSRVFWNGYIAARPPYQNTWDIRQAYVQLGSLADGWVDAIAGREVLSLGEERLVGPSDWLNMGRTFDLARLDLHHSWFRLSLFASSVIVARDGVIDHHNEGNNLHGAYGHLTRIVPAAVVEPYVLWRVAPATVHLSENAGRGALNEVTVGFRAIGKVPGNFEYDVEMARQAGSLGPDSIDSWAGHWNIAKPLNGRLKPRPYLEANYATGTKNPSSANWGTFDQIYPSAHDKMDFADQVGWRNIEQVRAGVSEAAARKWKFTETYENFWLASARDALYAASGAPVAQSATGSAGRHVGGEFDAWAEWGWKDAVALGFGYARFFTGRFLNRTTEGKDFNLPFVYLNYNFTPSTSPHK